MGTSITQPAAQHAPVSVSPLPPFSPPSRRIPRCRAYEQAFSPGQGATALVVKTIQQAETSVRLAAYSFTSLPIAHR